jgi:hypothetical protein
LAGPASTNGSETFELVQATQEFVGGEEMNITAQNLRVHIPRNSITWTGTISITTRDPSLFLVEGETEWARPQVFSVEFLNEESTPVPGIIFSNPIQICFRITNEQWMDFTERPDAYQVQYFAVEENPPVWKTLPLKAYAAELCGLVNHLSLFALAMHIEQSIPVTGPTATASPTPTRTRRGIAPTEAGADEILPASTRPLIPTATDVPSVTPADTSEPGTTPVPTNTSGPTNTPKPINTSGPTGTPQPTDEPTQAPTEEPTQAPTEEPSPPSETPGA